MSRRVDVLGLPIDALTMQELTSVVVTSAVERQRLVVAHHNMHSLYLVQKDAELRAFYLGADIVHADGMAVVAIARALGRRLERGHRTTYVDWIHDLLAAAAAAGLSIYFVGGEVGVGERAHRVIAARHPEIRFGFHHGYFDATPRSPESMAVVAACNEFAPDLVLVGMGMPRQEHWLDAHVGMLEGGTFLLTGACMDYLAAEVPTPPRLAGRLGLEWLFRLLAEPRRLWRRYLLEPLLLAGLLARHRWRRARGHRRGQGGSTG